MSLSHRMLAITLTAADMVAGSQAKNDGQPDFPAAASILDGFDVPDDSSSLCRGDRMLFGLLIRGKESETVRMIGLRVLRVGIAPGESIELSENASEPMKLKAPEDTAYGIKEFHLSEKAVEFALIETVVYDSEGAPLDASQSFVPDAVLGHGFYSVGKVCEKRPDAEAPKDVQDRFKEELAQPLGGALASLNSFFTVVSRNSSLDEIGSAFMSAVVREPSLIDKAKALLNGNRNAGLVLQVNRIYAVELSIPTKGTSAFVLPGEFRILGKVATSFSLIVIPPMPLYCITGGIVGIEGAHPGHADRFFRLSLLAARHAPSD